MLVTAIEISDVMARSSQSACLNFQKSGRPPQIVTRGPILHLLSTLVTGRQYRGGYANLLPVFHS
jgi:hypothetical protein